MKEDLNSANNRCEELEKKLEEFEQEKREIHAKEVLILIHPTHPIPMMHHILLTGLFSLFG